MAKISKETLNVKKKNILKKKRAKKSIKPTGFLKTKSSKNIFLSEKVESSDSEVNDVSENNGEVEADDVNDQNLDSDSDSALDEEAIAKKHKKDLEKLKESDPEFYKFLQENDKKLLQFSMSDDEIEESEQTNEQDDAKKLEKVHKPIETLEVASDESDFEDEGDEERDKDHKIITSKMIKKWQNDIQTDKSNRTITEVIHAFHAALKRVSSVEEQDDEPTHYKVEGSFVFNAVIQLCVMELGPSIRRYLGLRQSSKQPPHKCKKFNKIKRILKSYFTDLLKLLVGVTSSNIQTVLLKHLHYMCPMLSSFTNITKSILKKIIILWGTTDDSVRVLAFFCILRITNSQMGGTLDMSLKSMYMTYVKNSKFVSLNSLASINFMRRSLVEMFMLDMNVTYSHVFLYIRQLAIHLRNAIIVNKKENIQAVCNWQYINSLKLWGNLLSVTYNKQQMQQLVYPFVQVCLGTLKLVPTAQYYPLRFHVVQILIDFCKDTRVFVPVLPFLLEVLTSYDFDKKHKKISMKPLHFTCLLRLSKSQMQENGFKDSVIDTIYSQLLEYLASLSHTISFPDLSIICILQIKQFIKKCRTVKYTRKLKQVLEKIEQNAHFIESERSKLTLDLTNVSQIEGWESQIKIKGTPLNTYYESWTKMRNLKKNKEITNNEALGDYKLPTLKKLSKNNQKSNISGPVEWLPSDSECSDNDLEKRPKRGKRGGKNAKRNVFVREESIIDDGEKDIVEDIQINDW